MIMGKNLLKAIALSSLVLSGCNNCIQQDAKEAEKIKEMNMKDLEKGPEMVDYFGSIDLYHKLSTASVAITSGDFNNDENLDVVIANLDDNGTRLFFYEGDGKGNFKLRKYEKKK